MIRTERYARVENAAMPPSERFCPKPATAETAIVRWGRLPAAPLLPYYHCITDAAPPHLAYVQTPRHPAQFTYDVTALRRYTRLRGVSPERLPLRSGGRIPNHGIITFDDGLRDGLHSAVDLALDAGFTVVLFICPAFIGNLDLMYRHKASLLASVLCDVVVSGSTSMRLSGMLAEWGVSAQDASTQLLQVRNEERSVLDTAARMLGIDVKSYARHSRPYLEVDELRAFAQRGVFLGSHGLDHAPVCSAQIEERVGQNNESFELIQDIVHQEFRLFSYPFGDAGISQHAIDNVLQCCKLDYSFGTAGWRPERNPRHKQRLRMEVPVSAGSILATEMLRNVVRYVIGRTVPCRRNEVIEIANT
jgi:peptidoglycan/xylan/chitin deacetylase (PgdA/CDA1 family)